MKSIKTQRVLKLDPDIESGAYDDDDVMSG